MFSCTKWLPASMLGTSFVRWVRLALVSDDFGFAWLLHCKADFKSVNEMTDCAVPMGLGILGCSLQCNGCNELVACRSVRRTCSVICKEVLADRSGTAVSAMFGHLELHETLYVFSHKVAPGVDVGNLVCATGAACARE